MASLPSKQLAGWVSVSVYVPGLRLPNEYAPLASVIAVLLTGPLVSAPVRAMATPAIGVSPGSLMPLLFPSTYANPDRLEAFSSPKLLLMLWPPEGKLMLAIWSLVTVPPNVPAVSLPSMKLLG